MPFSRLRAAVARQLGRWAPVWWAVLLLSILLLGTTVVLDMMYRLSQTRGIWQFIAHPFFNGEMDGSLPEVIGYGQMAVAAVALVYLGVRLGRAWTHLVLAAAMVVLILDDSLELHENWGRAFRTRVGLPDAFHLRAQDLGEIAILGLLGLVFLVVLIVAWRFSGERARRQSWVILGGFVLLAFFGGALDVVGPIVKALGATLREVYLVTLAESSGELAAMGVIMLSALFFAFQQSAERRAELTAPAAARS